MRLLTTNPDEARRLAALNGAQVYALTADGVEVAPLCIPRSLLPNPVSWDPEARQAHDDYLRNHGPDELPDVR